MKFIIRRRKTSHGYIMVRISYDHPMVAMALKFDGMFFIYEHRLVAASILGRPLLRSEQVHHINRDRSDNRRENLMVCSSTKEHREQHFPRSNTRHLGEDNPVIECACGCGGSLSKFDEFGRPRKMLHGHNGRSGIRTPRHVPSGERIHNSKLNDSVVQTIRAEYTSGSATIAQLALRYGVHRATINSAAKGWTWKNAGESAARDYLESMNDTKTEEASEE